MNMMKKLQKMQKDMVKAQDELAATTFEGSAQGLVKVFVNGKKEVLSIEINEEILSPEDKEMVEDLILTAMNQAFKIVDETTEAKMGAFAQGANFPGLF
jgi:DNA-binding YbaB/EbfC family protein